MKLIKTLEVANELGEGVIWNPANNSVMWTDIIGCKLYAYNPDSDVLQQWDTPHRLCCFSPIENDERLVVAFDQGFAFYHAPTSEVEWIEKLESDNPGTRFNDGKTDRQGRFWCGTMVENHSQAHYEGSLYCLNRDLSIHKTISGLKITNSLCWSKNGKVAYHTDTPTQQIDRYEFDIESGQLSSASAFAHTDPQCFPDGSCVDNDDHLWNAQWGGGKVVRYRPDGNIDFELEVPCQQPSCVGFAGKDLNLLVVTSAWQGLNDEQRLNDPRAGHLFIYDTPFIGVTDSPFSPLVK